MLSHKYVGQFIFVIPSNLFQYYDQVKQMVAQRLSSGFLNAIQQNLTWIRINGKGAHWLQQDAQGKLYPYSDSHRDNYNPVGVATYSHVGKLIDQPWLLGPPNIQGQEISTTQVDLHNDHALLGIRFNPLYSSAINVGDVVKVAPFLRLNLDDCLFLQNDSLTFSFTQEVLEKLRNLDALDMEKAINNFAYEILERILNYKKHTIKRSNKLIPRFNIRNLEPPK